MASFTYEGDINEVAPWLAFARSQQKRMAELGSPGWNIQPEPDVLIMIRTTPPHIHIKVGGGPYHFIHSDAVGYFKYRGFRPNGSDPVTGVSATRAKSSEADVLTTAAPLSDRHAWYGADGVTVLSGYGDLYVTNRAPHIYMSNAGLFLGTVELYQSGNKAYKSPMTAWNGAMFLDYLIGISIDGTCQYMKVGEEAPRTMSNPIGQVPNVVSTTFAQNIPPAWVNGNEQDWYYVYDGHVQAAGFEIPACYWSFSKDGSRAVGVSYANYHIDYLAYNQYNEIRMPQWDMTDVQVVPFLIEIHFAEIILPDGTTEVQCYLDGMTQMDMAAQGKFLIAADFYYYPPKNPDFQQSYEPDEDEMVMLFAEVYNYGAGGETYPDGEPVDVENLALIIESKSKRYIRDLYFINTELFGIDHSPSFTDWVEAEVQAVDLRTMSYAIDESRRSDLTNGEMTHRVMFRGVEVFSCKVTGPSVLDKASRIAYQGHGVVDNRAGNQWEGFWGYFRLDGYLAPNPFADNLFYYYRGNIGAGVYIVDVYTYFNENAEIPAYEVIYQYHYLSAGSIIGDKHCTAHTWVI